MFNLEVNRRIGNAWMASAQVRLWSGIADDDPLYAYRRDDYIELSVARYY